MAVIYLLILAVYFSGISMGMSFVGMNWHTFSYKYKQPPQRLVILLYVLNFLVMTYAFQVPFLVQFFLNIFIMLALYVGSKLQIIGLTGGIATGKSTVSKILSENGFDIIDADQISKEVSLLNPLYYS